MELCALSLKGNAANCVPEACRQLAESFKNIGPTERSVFPEEQADNHCALVHYLHVSVVDQFAKLSSSSPKPRGRDEFLTVAVFEPNPNDSSQFDVRDEEFMFVANVKLVEREKVISVPATVRLYCVDNVPGDCGGYLPVREIALHAPLDFFSFLVKGKFGVLRSLRGKGELHIAPREVERRMKIVDYISEDESELRGREFLHCYGSRIASSITIVIDRDSMISLTPCFPDLKMEAIQEFIAAPYFSQGILKDHGERIVPTPDIAYERF